MNFQDIALLITANDDLAARVGEDLTRHCSLPPCEIHRHRVMISGSSFLPAGVARRILRIIIERGSTHARMLNLPETIPCTHPPPPELALSEEDAAINQALHGPDL